MSLSTSSLQAASAARVYLEMRGYNVVEQHYKRSRSEIDVVATKAGIVYFVEVNHNKPGDDQSSHDAMSASKLQKMLRAAESWIDEYKWQGPYQLGAIELADDSYIVMGFVDNVTA